MQSTSQSLSLSQSQSQQEVALYKEELIKLSEIEVQKKSNYYENFGALIYLNMVLLLLQSLTSAGKNVLYQVFADANYQFLGPTQFICNYLFGPFMLLIVDNLIEKFTFNILFYFAAFNLNIFLFGGILVTACDGNHSNLACQSSFIISICIICSLLAGLLQTVYYVSYVAYINSISNLQNKSFYFGFSFSVNAFANIFSNLIGYYLHQQFGNFYLYMVIVILSLIIQLSLLCIPDRRNKNLPQSRSFKENIIYQYESIKSEIFGFQFRKLAIYLFYAGLMNSVIYLFQPAMVKNSIPSDTSDKELESKIFISFLVTGIGQIMGGLLSGKLAEKIMPIYVSYLSLSINLFGILFGLFSFLDTKFYLSLIGGYLIGFCDSSTSSIALTLLTKDISQTNHVFAGFNLFQYQSFGFGLPSLYWMYFNQQSFYYDLSFLLGWTILSFISLIIYEMNQVKIEKKFGSLQ